MRSVSIVPAAEYRTQDCNCLALRQAARHVTQHYDQYLASAGLRSTQFSILARLHRKGPMTINELAAELVMDRTTLGRNVLPLQRDGLIEIRTAAHDRRRKELRLTDIGSRRLAMALEAWDKAQESFEASFGKTRARELRGLLGAVVGTGFQGVI
jgi:DNA-binding MarR family transcriptional regulator